MAPVPLQAIPTLATPELSIARAPAELGGAQLLLVSQSLHHLRLALAVPLLGETASDHSQVLRAADQRSVTTQLQATLVISPQLVPMVHGLELVLLAQQTHRTSQILLAPHTI